MTHYKIIGIAIRDRIKEARKTQEVLSKYSCIIRTRLGFHEVNEYTCSRIGFIILQVIDDNKQFPLFIKDLNEIAGIEIQEMSFNI